MRKLILAETISAPHTHMQILLLHLAIAYACHLLHMVQQDSLALRTFAIIPTQMKAGYCCRKTLWLVLIVSLANSVIISQSLVRCRCILSGADTGGRGDRPRQLWRGLPGNLA